MLANPFVIAVFQRAYAQTAYDSGAERLLLRSGPRYRRASGPGSLVNAEITNFQPPSFSPETGLFYFPKKNSHESVIWSIPIRAGRWGSGARPGEAVLLTTRTLMRSITRPAMSRGAM